MLKPTTASYDKEAVGWSLSWHPDGRCDSFTKEAILACAPPTSGVYGLFNFDCQVFIGESPNIQEALLRHESETDFQSQPLRPTGFTFEACAAELRELKANELIAKFRPVLQTQAGLIEIRSLSNSLTLREVTLRDRDSKTRLDHQEFPARDHEKHAKTRPLFYLNKWTQATALAAAFVASGAIIFYFGPRAEQNNQKRLNGASGAPLKRISGQDSTWGQDGSSLRPQKSSSISTPSGGANQSAEVTLGSELNTSSAATENAKVRLAPKITTDDPLPVQPFLERAKPSPVVHLADPADLGEKWSVQVSAGSAKDIAGSLVERLKANGYDGYVIQAEVKGQTYYRVRVGRFATREEAESVRRSLALEEGYRDAYLTGD